MDTIAGGALSSRASMAQNRGWRVPSGPAAAATAAPAPATAPVAPPLPLALAARAAPHDWLRHPAGGDAHANAEGFVDSLLALPQSEMAAIVQAYQQQSEIPAALHAAVGRGDRGRAVQLLAAVTEIECAVDWRDAKGRTAAFVATEQGDAGSLALLVSRGADLQATDRRGRSLLHAAARAGALDCARVLIRLDGRMTEAADADGAMPLHAAAAGGVTEAVHLLLSAGATVSSTDCFGRTPLHVAAAAGQVEVILELLHADMDGLLAARDADKRSARALAAGHKSIAHKAAVSMLDMFSAWPAIARGPLLKELRGGFPRAARTAEALLKQVRDLAANPSVLTLGTEEAKKLVEPAQRYTPRTKRTPRKAAIEPQSTSRSASRRGSTSSLSSPRSARAWSMTPSPRSRSGSVSSAATTNTSSKWASPPFPSPTSPNSPASVNMSNTLSIKEETPRGEVAKKLALAEVVAAAEAAAEPEKEAALTAKKRTDARAKATKAVLKRLAAAEAAEKREAEEAAAMAEIQAELERKNSGLAAQLMALKQESRSRNLGLRPKPSARRRLAGSKRLPLDRRDSNTQEEFGLHATTMTLGNLPAVEDRSEGKGKGRHTSFAPSGNIAARVAADADVDITVPVTASWEKGQDQLQQEDQGQEDQELEECMEEWLIRELGVTTWD